MAEPTASAILADLATALRTSGAFAEVTVGAGGSASAAATLVPRTVVSLEGYEYLRLSDSPEEWWRLRAKVSVRTRRDSSPVGASEAASRLAELASAATAAVLLDGTRGGLCCDLPVGDATEVERAAAVPPAMSGASRPAMGANCGEAEIVLHIRCHYATGELPGVTVDDAEPFASGPCWLRPGAAERALEHRELGGDEGEVIVDLGPRPRSIVQTGRLVAATAEELQTQIAAIEALVDGQEHTLAWGESDYGSVLLEQFELIGPPRHGARWWCEYRCKWLQLADG